MALRGRGGVSLVRRALTALACGLGSRVGSAVADDREDVRAAGEYLLRTRILHAGTRSEGRVGRLFRNGSEVPGRTPGEFIDAPTPSGTVRFTYMGEARPHLWSTSGWTDRAPQP